MTIHKEYASDISKEILFAAWVSSETVVSPVVKIESNPVVGGQYKLYSESEYGESIMCGKFEEVVPNEKLKYSWHWEGSDEETVVTVGFSKESNRTVVTIDHEGFKTIESMNLHDTGWDSYFQGLIDRIEKT